MPRLPQLLRRLPSLFGRPVASPIVRAEHRAAFKDLEPDFRFLDRELASQFERFDLEALRQQSRYRRQQLLLLTGGVVGAIVGALEAVFTRQIWLGAAVALLALVSVGYAQAIERRQALRHYVDQRTRAEQLRSLYFQYVARVGPYGGDDRETRLSAAVAAIAAKDPA